MEKILVWIPLSREPVFAVSLRQMQNALGELNLYRVDMVFVQWGLSDLKNCQVWKNDKKSA